MAVQKSLLILLLAALSSSSVDSFTVGRPSSFAPATTTTTSWQPRTTCLFAEEEEETAASDDKVESGEAAPAVSAETDILNSPAFLKRKVEVLKSDIAAIEQEIEEAKATVEAGKAEWGAQLDALRAEYKNIQERMASQSETRDVEVTRSAVREMLDILDNFDRAFGVVKATTDEEAAIEAEYKEAYQMILDVITGLGVETVPTVGIEFDYELHQAVMQKPSADYDEGIVCEEFQKGFKIGDTLIRAAMVAVAA